MAIYIEITKLKKERNSVIYQFALVDGRSGKFKIDEASGKITLLEALPNDDGNLFSKAAYKIRKSWEKNKENLPEITCWAS